MSHLVRNPLFYEGTLQLCDGQLSEVPPSPPKRPYIPPERTRNAFDKRASRPRRLHYQRARESLSHKINQPQTHRVRTTRAANGEPGPSATSLTFPVHTGQASGSPSGSEVNSSSAVSGAIQAALCRDDQTSANSNLVTLRLPETAIERQATPLCQRRDGHDPRVLTELGYVSQVGTFSASTGIQNEAIGHPTHNLTEGSASWDGGSSRNQPTFGAHQPRDAMALSVSAGSFGLLDGKLLLILCPVSGASIVVDLSQIPSAPGRERFDDTNQYLTGMPNHIDHHPQYNGLNTLSSQSTPVNAESQAPFNFGFEESPIASTRVHSSFRLSLETDPDLQFQIGKPLSSSSSSPELTQPPNPISEYVEQDITPISPSASSTFGGDASADLRSSVSCDDDFSLFDFDYANHAAL